MKTFLSHAFPLVVLALFVASIWYVAMRLQILFGLPRRWPLQIVVVAAFIFSLVAMLSAAGSTSKWAGLLNVLGGYVFSFYVFLLLLLLLFYVAQQIWRLPGNGVASSALVLALALTVFGAMRAGYFSINEIEIPLDGLNQDVVVAHISDLHIGHHRGSAYLARIVEETNRHQPDIVLINGDLVDSDVALLPGVLSPLSDFEAPVYFVEGNHDNYVDTKRAKALIAKHGVRILHNEIVDTHGIYLVGLDYMNPDENTFDMHPSENKLTIKNVLPSLAIAEDKPSVLMHHSPVGTQYVSEKGIDMMVSGHTHGGQMFPGTLLAPLIFPFNRGLYKEGEMTLLVSQGAGTFGVRLRLGTSNEINLIRLKKNPSLP